MQNKCEFLDTILSNKVELMRSEFSDDAQRLYDSIEQFCGQIQSTRNENSSDTTTNIVKYMSHQSFFPEFQQILSKYRKSIQEFSWRVFSETGAGNPRRSALRDSNLTSPTQSINDSTMASSPGRRDDYCRKLSSLSSRLTVSCQLSTQLDLDCQLVDDQIAFLVDRRQRVQTESGKKCPLPPSQIQKEEEEEEEGALLRRQCDDLARELSLLECLDVKQDRRAEQLARQGDKLKRLNELIEKTQRQNTLLTKLACQLQLFKARQDEVLVGLDLTRQSGQVLLKGLDKLRDFATPATPLGAKADLVQDVARVEEFDLILTNTVNYYSRDLGLPIEKDFSGLNSLPNLLRLVREKARDDGRVIESDLKSSVECVNKLVSLFQQLTDAIGQQPPADELTGAAVSDHPLTILITSHIARAESPAIEPISMAGQLASALTAFHRLGQEIRELSQQLDAF